MRIEQLGEGEPELAIVAAIHGDEPCGVRAVERLLADESTVERPVRLIVANEKALAEGVRYVDTDLNRAFDEETSEDAHERELAVELAEAVRGCTVLSIHSTRSAAKPFAITSGLNDLAREIVPHLSVRALVETGVNAEGRLFAAEADILEVEAGYQGSVEAAENAYRLVREFLTTTGAIAGQTIAHDLEVYEQGEPVEKPPAEEYEVFAENFVHVDAGETYAAVDGEGLAAQEGFDPILFSAYGYEHIFGYRGTFAGTLRTTEDGTATLTAD
ncbi:succinylglutamate desuccinylase/aspartoacylase domain-containing protein [Halorhabdus rudnickae]|uniref:succinylglutamate desuccinylase/aspartoacylase domain-containing protein n=1 Tax=Halorhabdus rudnickae TaxID=1775544 RepID=UPI0010843CD8|nr:succinylglutamate desuccinylase/aspartoacylase family protein [Halorhabdus rudnickae]